MNQVPTNPHRRSIRLRGYDYSQAGACLFGDIVGGEMELKDAGEMIERWWSELNRKYSAVETGEFVVMPNHFHGIANIAPTDHFAMVQNDDHQRIYSRCQTTGLGGWAPFPGKLWQRNYYEHVVRNEAELNRIRQYIADNPSKWALDENFPGMGERRALPY